MINGNAHDIARLEPHDGIEAHRHAARRASRNHIARLQSKGGGEVFDNVKAVKDKILGIRRLPQLAIDPGLQIQGMRIVDLICGDHIWSHGAMRIPGFAHGKRRRRHLPVAHAHVVHHRITGDYLGGIRLGHAAAALADDNAQFAFIVELLRFCRQVDIAVRPRSRGRLLVENHWHLRRRHARFFNVVAVIQTHRENFWRTQNWRLQSDIG